MVSSQLTMTDLCRVTGYTRDQVRGLLDVALPERSSKGPRVAREFRPQELILVAAMTELETRFGIKRSHVAVVAKRLAQVLSGPKSLNREARLLIAFDPPKVTYAAELIPTVDGVVMSLGLIFDRVDRYVSAAAAGSTRQQPLRLGPTMLRTATRRTST